MTMVVCDNGHAAIVYDDERKPGYSHYVKTCPLCELIHQKEQEVGGLENKIIDLENECDMKDAEIEDLKASIPSKGDEHDAMR